MLRHRSSLKRHFTPKASAICFPSVKGRFCSPSVLIYREVRVRTRGAATKKRPASASRFSILWWAVRGSACSAGGRCGAFAPCALRWQTLTRFLSSAPRRVRTHAPATKKRPTGVDRFLFYGGPSGVQPAPQAAAAALSRLARCAGKRSRVSSAPRPDGFEPMHRQQKSDQPESIAFFSMVGRQGFEPWTLGLKGAPRLISQLDSDNVHPL